MYIYLDFTSNVIVQKLSQELHFDVLLAVTFEAELFSRKGARPDEMSCKQECVSIICVLTIQNQYTCTLFIFMYIYLDYISYVIVQNLSQELNWDVLLAVLCLNIPKYVSNMDLLYSSLYLCF